MQLRINVLSHGENSVYLLRVRVAEHWLVLTGFQRIVDLPTEITGFAFISTPSEWGVKQWRIQCSR